jgi:type 1 glutamine amidotransferase/catechol 2,3-dioxygenase-like lactoylglutathione lyase family enzyme
MRVLGILCAMSGVFGCPVVAGAAEDAPAGKVRVLYVFNGGHNGRGFLEHIGKVLDGTGDFTVTPAQSADDLKTENIGKYDVVLFYGSGGTITDVKQEQGLWDFVHRGGGIVAVHATDANKKSDIYWELLGGRFIGHGGGKYSVHVYDSEHPITAGMGGFEISDETYAHEYHKNACMRCLVRMDRGGERQSMAWVQQFGKGRVFTTGFGDNQGAWNNPHFQRLVVRAMYWSAGRLPKDPRAAASDFPRTTIDLGAVVGDVEKSVAFYTQAVGMNEVSGFEVTGQFAGDAGLTDHHPVKVHVLLLGDGPTATRLKLMELPAADPKPADNGFLHSQLGFRYITIGVTDMGAAVARLQKAGVKPLAKCPIALPGTLSSRTYLTVFRDPDGNFVEFVGPMAATRPR